MILNPQTGKYELPPPRWFNKSTGEYEDIKPMYFLDSHNPDLGIVPANRIVREDDAFRQFIEDKEMKRQLRIQRDLQDLERRKLEVHHLPSEATKKVKVGKERDSTPIDFDEEVAQREFRERSGRMISKRSATKLIGPSKEDKMRKMEEKYSALKPLVPLQDAEIEKLHPAINEEEIISAWRNSPAVRSDSKPKKAGKSEAERARELVKSKTGLRSGIAGLGLTFSAMKGSYRPPNTIDMAVTRGWDGTPAPTLSGKEDVDHAKKKLRGWRSNELHSSAWWENSSPTTRTSRVIAAERWRERDKLRDQRGRISVNPDTGKIEDLKPAKVDVKNYGVSGSLIGLESEGPWMNSTSVTPMTGEEPWQTGLLFTEIEC
jgi:hypothetical protein